MILALGVHAAIATAFIGESAKEPAPPPEVEIEILAAITSEATPVDLLEVMADAMQATEASEAASGDVANVPSELPEEVASITPVETVTPPDPDSKHDEFKSDIVEEIKPEEQPGADQAGKAVVDDKPREQPSENASQEELAETKSVETATPQDVPSAEAVSEVEPVESLQQALEMAPVEPSAIVPPVELATPLVEAAEAPKIAALPVPEEVIDRKEREPLKEAKKTKPVKKAAERKAERSYAKPKPGKTKVAAKQRAQRQMVAGSRESKVAKREGKSAAKRSGGKIATSAYRSIVQARINAPKGALQATVRLGMKGSVIVGFSIGASGRVTRASVTKSSGNGAVDSAARAVVASTSFPPPPGGSFSARVPIVME